MTFHRALAAVVTAAVTTPVALLAAAPAFAQPQPASLVRNAPLNTAQNQATYEELRKAAAEAKKAYDDAVTAKEKGHAELDATLKALESESHPLNAAWRAAEQAAKDAAGAKDAADQAVKDAKAALDAAGSEADRAEAQKALDKAGTAQAEAVEKLDAAREKAKAARTELEDARVAAFRTYHLVSQALEDARTAKEAADKALAEAKECVRETALTSAAVGLPAKVVAGEPVEFTFRISNGTTRTLSVDPLTAVHLKGGKDEPLKVEWSDGSRWQALEDAGAVHLDRVDAVQPGGRTEVRMRISVAAGTARTEGFALFAADAFDAYKPCVLGPMKRYDFEVLPAGSEPGEVDDAKPGKPGAGDDERPGAGGSDAGKGEGSGGSAQGGAGKPAADGAKGDLAQTGSSSSTLPLALAGAGAVVLGAGAVLVVRRRKAATES